MQRGCAWKARAGAEGRRGTGAFHGQCFCADVLKHPGLKCKPGKAGVIFFEGGTSTHLLRADGRALPQEDSDFVEGVREVHYRSEVLQAPKDNSTATTVYSAHNDLGGKGTDPHIRERRDGLPQ